ncbi:alpha-mannosidase 2-like, partial [Augochlora pura]
MVIEDRATRRRGGGQFRSAILDVADRSTVILVPHSHTDPGWLKTYEQYFHSSTRSILNNMVSKLQQWPNMTFIWSEVSFLSLWWE